MWRSGGKRALVAAAALAAVPLAARQEPGVFRSAAQLVPVFATVTAPDGRLVTDLTQDDFVILDNGAPQPIALFSNEIQPINIVVMLDTSGSMSGNLARLRDASVQLFTHLLPADKARVGNFGDRIAVSPRFTSDQDELIRWLWTEMSPGGATPLWGAINAGMTALDRLEGRRVVLVFTDGRDASNRVRITLRDVTRRAQTQEFMVYGIGMWSRGAFGRGGSRRGRRPQAAAPDPGLKRIAEETGGGYFELLDDHDLGPTFARVAEELHRQYLIGFSAPQPDGQLHALEVRLRRPGLSVRARQTYVAPSAGAGDRR
jgi:Ca-activated chloride channel family protein